MLYRKAVKNDFMIDSRNVPAGRINIKAIARVAIVPELIPVIGNPTIPRTIIKIIAYINPSIAEIDEFIKV